MKNTTRFLVALSELLLAGAVWAAPFQNGSFEVPGTGGCNIYDLGVGNTSITGWTVVVGNIDWEGPPACGWAPSDGSHSLDLVGQFFGVGGIEQSFDTIPGVTYRVSFDLAGNYGAGPVIKPLAVTINGVTTNFNFDTTGRSQFDMGWTTHTLTFVATGTSSTIRFVSDVSAAGGTLNAGAALDNVRIAPLDTSAAAIPLDWAGSLAALAIMVAAAGVLRRRGAARR
jgi:choice-of-anchor C domain-containing protein